LTNDVEEINPPADASTSGLLIEMLMEFLQKANIDGEDEDRKRLLRGIPVVTTYIEEHKDPIKCVVFRMRDFVTFLKKNRFEEFTQGLWHAHHTHEGRNDCHICVGDAR
jgi:hypothetical protein